MTLEEFKRFMMDENAKLCTLFFSFIIFIGFRKIMMNIRKINDRKFEDTKKIYMPMNFNAMLLYLHQQMQHKNIHQEIKGVDSSIGNRA